MAVMHSDEEIADTYLRHYELKKDEDFWAFEEMDQILRNDPEHGWRLTCLLVSKAPSDEALAYVAAGPLENFINYQADSKLMDMVASAARGDQRLQLALSGVWVNRKHQVWERWSGLMNEFGFTRNRPAL